ncbi:MULTISPECIES: GntR family transcriptional regulator [Sphingomonas]|uniref:GntR family transcriptional regulator n=1 Tax=Sphingomonas leidyi TaxID=68569 RepID=A0A7X5UZ78_9SPHN|nr:MULTISPECIES: GntR family transcriptional regulator [Sphingomonas]MBN8813671.1 GntR family transcriptional regulator [Sphingomonas sp.]NIJ64957.1 GntR family transcriptional regulator [Sphingomonas leidyi]
MTAGIALQGSGVHAAPAPASLAQLDGNARLGELLPRDRKPLYAQFAHLLRRAITEGRLEAGAALPPERDLAAEYGVSRITIRKAIAELAEDGLLTRKQGAGTTVTRRIEQNFSRISSFSEEMTARGQLPSSAWILRAAGAVTPVEAMQLNLSPGAPVMRFHRVRIADDAPMAVEFSTVPSYCLGGIDDVSESLYAALALTGHRPVRALQRLRAVPFTGSQARLLRVEAGTPGLLIERCGFLRDGRPVEYTQSYYRGDTYDFVAELTDL